MKFKSMTNPVTMDMIFSFIISDSEFVTSNPTSAEKVCQKLYMKTKKISDGLMYLSEVAKRIEDTP